MRRLACLTSGPDYGKKKQIKGTDSGMRERKKKLQNQEKDLRGGGGGDKK